MRLKVEPWGREEFWVLPIHILHATPCRYRCREGSPTEHRLPRSTDLLPEARPDVRGNCPTVPHCRSVRERGCATRAVTLALCLEGPCASVTPRRLKVLLKKESGGVVATGTVVSTGGVAQSTRRGCLATLLLGHVIFVVVLSCLPGLSLHWGSFGGI